MIENVLVAASLVGLVSIFFMVYKGIFAHEQTPVRIPVRVEDDGATRRIRIRYR